MRIRNITNLYITIMTTLRNNKYVLPLVGMLLFLFLFCMSLFSILFYNRFIRELLPHSLPTSFSTLQLIIYCGLFTISVIMFFTLIYKLLFSSTNKPPFIPENAFTFMPAKLREIWVSCIVGILSLLKNFYQN